MHVVVNAATSVDGKLSSRRREQIAISGPDDFSRVDELRAASDAVMVGIGTVLADDPSLTVDGGGAGTERGLEDASTQPARVIADSLARTPTDATVLDNRSPTYVLVTERAPDGRREELEAAGAEVLETPGERVDFAAGLSALEDRGIERLLVEGGGEVIFSMFAAGLVDELTVFVGSTLIGGRDAPTLADGDGFTEEFPELSLESVERLDDGVLLEYRA